jgi:hypothetical protein
MISFATDTCLTNQNLWTRLANNPETKHVITVPCDSHGIQLLIKDLLLLVLSINLVWQKASTIVNTLRNATKQYQFLQQQQERVYRKQKALIAAGFTRWGTQYRLAKAVGDSRQALQHLALQDDSGF